MKVWRRCLHTKHKIQSQRVESACAAAPHCLPRNSMSLTLEVPNPIAGFDFLTDSACGPMELTRGPVAGPGEASPYALFSCSLEMKICAAKQGE